MERLLEGVSGNGEHRNHAGKSRNLRPSADSINAVRCASCGQVEYITRDYCRCGHYLAGQIEDEYLVWERNLVVTHERLTAEVDRKLKSLRLATIAGLPFMAWPLVYPAFFGGSVLSSAPLWMLTGVVIIALFGKIGVIVGAQREASARVLETATFEQFLIERVTAPSD